MDVEEDVDEEVDEDVDVERLLPSLAGCNLCKCCGSRANQASRDPARDPELLLSSILRLA